MDENKKFTVKSATARIENNGGKIGGKVIDIEKPGLKVLSAISYLVNHEGYSWAKHMPGKM